MDSNHTSLPVNSLHSAFKKDENYYLEELLEDCNYIIRHIIDDFKRFSDSDESNKE